MNEKENGIIVSNQVVEMIPLSCNTVLNDIEETGLEMWNHCITNEFPISEVIRKGNEVILNIGSPHNGFIIESVMNEGKLNGKAIMKNDKGMLIGEFEYVNGEANGSCKLYYENGDLYFEGKLLNGYREGIGKEYDFEGNAIFEGIFVKGNRKKGLRIEDDYMIEYDEEGNRIIGYKRNDKCEKNGICYLYKDNKVWEVWKYDNNEKVCILINFEGNEMNEYNENGRVIYRGEYMESNKYRYIRNGFGRLYNNKGNLIYEGEWKNGMKQGNGRRYRNGNVVYDGKWIMGYRLGTVVLSSIVALIAMIVILFFLSITMGIVLLAIDVVFFIVLRKCYGSVLSHMKENSKDKKAQNSVITDRKYSHFIYWTLGGIVFSIVFALASIIILIISHNNLQKQCLGLYSGISLDIQSNTCNDIQYSSFIPMPFYESIEIGNNCFENVDIFNIDGLNELKSLKIGINSFTKKKNYYGSDSSRSFGVLNCIELESIEIGKYSFSDYGGGFELKNLPKLSTIKIGEIGSRSRNFYYSSFVIESVLIVDFNE